MPTRSDRPSLQQIIAIVSNTVRKQVRNSREGQLLRERHPEAADILELLEDQIANNIAGVVDNMLTEATGIES